MLEVAVKWPLKLNVQMLRLDCGVVTVAQRASVNIQMKATAHSSSSSCATFSLSYELLLRFAFVEEFLSETIQMKTSSSKIGDIYLVKNSKHHNLISSGRVAYRCTIPCSCMWYSADINCLIIGLACDSLNFESFWLRIKLRSSPPGTNSVTMQ